MTDIREKIKAKVERDAKAYQMNGDMPKLGPANSHSVGANIWAEKCLKLVEAFKHECFCDLSPPYHGCSICKALEAFEKELEK